MIINNQEEKSVKREVLEKIKSGEVKMKSKAHFILETVLIISSVFLILGLIIFLISFIHFYLRASGIWYLPAFGLRGFAVYFKVLPWFLIILSIILILILEILAKRFSFVWRRPIFYSLVIIILIALACGFMIEKTSFHPDLFLRAREGKLPFMGPIYREFGTPEFHKVHRGVVEETVENGFKIKTFDGQLLTVILAQEIHPSFEEEIKEGDSVVVMGDRQNDTIRALNIRKIDDEFRRIERRLPRPPAR